jgi:drug/metabolite transporter (DMT)-like permease
LYALHLPINQRVLYDMPAPTVTLYTLIAMSAVVVPTFLISDFLAGQNASLSSDLVQAAWRPVLGLALVTFFSRLTLFTGVKHLGGMQTALLGLSEILVALTFAYLWMGEGFTPQQWLGAPLLCASLALVAFEQPPPKKQGTGGFLSWLRPGELPIETWQSHD